MARDKSYLDQPEANQIGLKSTFKPKKQPELKLNDRKMDSESTKMDFESEEESNQSIQNGLTRPENLQSSHKQRSKSVPTESFHLKDQTDYSKYLTSDWGLDLSKARRASSTSGSGSTRLRLRQGYLPEKSESKFNHIGCYI